MTALSIIFGFRDRDTQRVERCLASLANQTFTDFEVIFVDYGSQPTTAKAVKSIVEQHPFTRYIYTEARGYAWNRSHALNIGGKIAQGDYLMTTDVDMIYAANFLEVFMAQAADNRELHILPYLLPEDFNDWDNVESYAGKFEQGTPSMLGACQMIATNVYREMRGYDEYYRYYGVEDRDIHHRLRLLGLDNIWMTDTTAMFHQWHAPANFSVKNLIPDGVAGRNEIHYLNHYNDITRNPDRWGIIHTIENRPALRFVDADTQSLKDCPDLYHVNDKPADPQAVNRLITRFNQLEAGHALAIHHADFPQRSRASDMIMKWANRINYRINPKTRLEYPTNHLHNFVVNFIEPPAPYIADYYLNLPAKQGMSILVKA